MARWFMRLMDAQARWARPVANALQGRLSALFQRIRPVRDALVGVWLGHPLHAMLSDGPIGIFFLASVFDVIGLTAGWEGAGTAARISVLTGLVISVPVVLAGLADYAETDGPPRVRATLHGTLMLVALALYLLSYAMRGDAAPASVGGVVLGLLGFMVLAAGGFVGGDVVFVLGNMVSRHAFVRGGPRWIPLELADGDAVAEGGLTKAILDGEPLVLVRSGEDVYALHDLCSHAGGPLSTGALVDGCIECPWHFSRFRVQDGTVTRGPAVYSQPTYEIRQTAGGSWEGRRSRSR